MFSVAPLKGLLENVYFIVKGKCELAMKKLYQTEQLAGCAAMINLPRGNQRSCSSPWSRNTLQSSGRLNGVAPEQTHRSTGHEITRHLLLGKKTMTNLDSVFKKQSHYFANRGPSSQSYGFSSGHVWMWELDYKESWAPKNRCFWTVVWRRPLRVP